MSQVFLNVDAAFNADFGSGTNNAKLNGTASGWTARPAMPGRGQAYASFATNTVAGPTNGVECIAATNPQEFWTQPLASDVTISGSITFNISALESSMSANVAINVVIEKCDGATGALTQIIKTTRTTELGTGATAQNWTETPTSTACKKGDRLRFRVFGDDAGTMATGYTFTVYFSGPTAGGLGDTYVTFTENFGFDPGPDQPATLGEWTKVKNFTTLGLPGGMAYGNGYWVAVGASGALYYATDPLGTWTSNTQGTNSFYRVHYANGYWVAVGGSSGMYYKASTPDGTWTSNALGAGNTWYDVDYANGTWVIVGSIGKVASKASTPDGTWTMTTYSTTEWKGVVWDGSQWVVAGYLSAEGNVAYGSDPTALTQRAITGTPSFQDIAYGNGYYVCPSTSGVAHCTDPAGTWSVNTAAEGYTAAWGPRWDGDTVGSFSVGDIAGAIWVAVTPDGAWTPNVLPTVATGKSSYDIGFDSTTNVFFTLVYGNSTDSSAWMVSPHGAPFYIYPTDTASDVATAAVDRRAWSSRGGGVANDVTNTGTGWTTPIQTTDTAGGTVVDWWTPQLTAFTLGGAIRVNVRGAESNGNANSTIRCEIAVCNSDGSSPTTWGVAQGNGELNTTSEAVQSYLVSGDDVAVTQGQRLRIRFLIDDIPAAAMAPGYTVTMYYAGADGASGDTYLWLGQTLTEYVSGPARVPYRSHMPQLLAH